MKKSIAQFEKCEKIKVALLKELADSLAVLRDEFISSYKMLGFSATGKFTYLNSFIKAQELFEELSNNCEDINWLSFYDAPKGWYDNVSRLRIILGDDDNELGRCVTQVIVCYIKFTEALLDINLSDF